MSRNNLILVIVYRGRYYVVSDVNADVQWNEKFAEQHINKISSRFTYNRGKALIRAHNLQGRLQTEYGVWEISL
jgi:hypothetical protein